MSEVRAAEGWVLLTGGLHRGAGLAGRRSRRLIDTKGDYCRTDSMWRVRERNVKGSTRSQEAEAEAGVDEYTIQHIPNHRKTHHHHRKIHHRKTHHRKTLRKTLSPVSHWVSIQGCWNFELRVICEFVTL